MYVHNSVVDPYIYYTDPDPDPALFVIYGSGSGSGSGPGSRLFYDTNIIFLKFFFSIFQFISYFVWLWRNSFKTDEKIWKDFKQILKKVIKHSRCLNLWSVFQLLDPDPDPDCESGSGSGLRIRIRIRIQGPRWIRIQSGSGSGSGSTTLIFINEIFEIYMERFQHFFCQKASMDKRGGKGLSEKCETTLHTLVREVQVSYHY